MSSQVVLIAETDPRTLDILPYLVSSHIPHVAIDLCTSAEAFSHKLRSTSYDTVTISPRLLQEYRTFKHQRTFYSPAPLLLTAGQEDGSMAYPALNPAMEGDAFDLIVKPIVPHEAVQSVQLALWQNRLLRLLTSKERASARFRAHMAACPRDLKAEEEFAGKLAAYERTFHALSTSMPLLLNSDHERSLFDMAASVEAVTRKQALRRLVLMCMEGPSH